MSTAPFFFLLASLLIMVRDGEVRFLLVQLDDSENEKVFRRLWDNQKEETEWVLLEPILYQNANFDPSKCEWGEWIPEQCSATCGEGTRSKTKVLVPKEGNVGDCKGHITKTEKCKVAECPVNCVWGEWEEGTCSKSCGLGLRTDKRTKDITEANGGKCSGKPSRVEQCNPQPCPIVGVACCEEKGVPIYCHGLCMLETSFAQSDSRSVHMRGCKKYEETIIECTVGSETVKYEEAVATIWCKDNKDVDGRNGCMSDDQCLTNARALCDVDPNCYGVSWYDWYDWIEPKLKLCLSREMEPKTDGWRTMMKIEDQEN